MRLTPPTAVGFSAERLGRIRPVMQKYVDEGKLAGLITAVARRGKLVHFETFGYRDLEGEKRMQESSIFRIRSMTKPVATTAAMMLHEEGRFQLDDPLSQYIPACRDLKVSMNDELVELEREINIRDLMIHTSGLVYEFDYDKTLAENVSELVKTPLGYQPGSRWQYGQSLSLLAYIIELLTGMAFDQFLQERIFDPLNMHDTAYFVPQEKQDRFTALYGPARTGGLGLLEAPKTSVYAAPRALHSGSSGLVGTAVDYLRFAQMLLNGGELDGIRLLSERTVRLMMQNHVPERLLPPQLPEQLLEGTGFGLGGYVVMDPAKTPQLHSEGTFGWMGASSTDFWIDPREEIVGVLMTQLDPYGTYPLLPQFKTLTYQALVN